MQTAHTMAREERCRYDDENARSTREDENITKKKSRRGCVPEFNTRQSTWTHASGAQTTSLNDVRAWSNLREIKESQTKIA